MVDTERFDFFISYARVEEQWAIWIEKQLVDRFDKRVTLRAWHFRPGDDFVADMDKALQTSDRVIPIISAAAYLVRRDACLGELDKAHAPKGRTCDKASPGPPSVRPDAAAFPSPGNRTLRTGSRHVREVLRS